MASPRWPELANYSACDIADALLKLNVPGAGYLVDISPINPPPPPPSQQQIQPPIPHSPTTTDPPPYTPLHPSTSSRIVAPASTILLSPKPTPSFPTRLPTPFPIPPSNLPLPSSSTPPFSDLTPPGSILLIASPPNATCASLGSIHALRCEKLGALAIVVSGRVRDVPALQALSIPVWSRGTSVVGAGAETRFHARDVGVEMGNGVRVEAGDFLVVDEGERGVVCVPKDRVDDVLELCRKGTAADEACEGFVREGGSVREAFARFR